jgi:hypothetical protein
MRLPGQSPATTTKDVGGVIKRNTDAIFITIAGVTVSIRGEHPIPGRRCHSLIVVGLISGSNFHFLIVLILARAVLQVSAAVLAPVARLDASLAV